MVLKLLIAFLLCAAVFSQNCNVDPCSLPPPANCAYEYCAVSAGSCTPTYYDDDDNVVCGDTVVGKRIRNY
jgi:hypothetical protein